MPNRKMAVFILNIDDYAPQIRALTYPWMKHFASKIGAEFIEITERKFPGWPVVYEKLQIHELGKGFDWIYFFDADTLIHPECIDFSWHIPNDTVLHNGQDMAHIRFRYDEHFAKDARNIGTCFTGDTVVAGSGHVIEDLSAGHKILGRDGQAHRIVKTGTRTYTGKMIELKAESIPSVNVTPEHPILVCSMARKYRRDAKAKLKAWSELIPSEPTWKDAGDVKVGDWVIVPRIKKVVPCTLRLSTQGGAGRPGKRQSIDVPIDDDVAWLLGLYVAEGFVSEGRVLLALSEKETDIASRAISIFKRRFGLKAITEKPQNGSMKVRVNCASLSRVLDEWCGHGARNKRVPDGVMNADEATIRSFLDGLIMGDGCKTPNSYRVSSVSKQLVFDMVALSHKIGLHVAAYKRKQITTHIMGRLVDCAPIYSVDWSLNAWNGTKTEKGRKPFGSARFIGEYVYLRVASVNTVNVIDLPVFNIETEGHEYGVPFIVHNCGWFTLAPKKCIDIWTPTEQTLDEVLDCCWPTVAEKNSGLIDKGHLTDDYVMSRNIARLGIKHDTVADLLPKIALTGAEFFFHEYLVPVHSKVVKIKETIKRWGL